MLFHASILSIVWVVEFFKERELMGKSRILKTRVKLRGIYNGFCKLQLKNEIWMLNFRI